jgi:heterodisulfide reductase subunit B
MEISYYPGCSLKTLGRNFERTTIELLPLFDIAVHELEDWYCCGVMYSMATDSLMHQIAPVRTLIRAKETGREKLLTLCSMCYNTLKRTALLVRGDREKGKTLRDFMDLENTEFTGNEVEVVHILQLLRDVGLDRIEEKVSDFAKESDAVPLRVAPYYGCMLTRPPEVAIDEVDDPSIMERILSAFGYKPVYFPFKTECCCSFHIVSNPDIVRSRTRMIVESALKNGADLLVLSCPLCGYNLDAVQREIHETDTGFRTLPVLYITQLLSLSLGIDPDINDFSLHAVDPRPVLEEKGLL